MNKLTHTVFLIFLILITQSCEKSAKGIEADYIESKVKTYGPKSDKRWMIILPGLGCKGCIQEGEIFLKQHISNDSILFVLTKVESIKLLRQKIGVDVKNHSNVLIDKSNSFELPSKNSIYPLIIELKDRKVNSYQFQSPENSDAFSRLEEKI